MKNKKLFYIIIAIIVLVIIGYILIDTVALSCSELEKIGEIECGKLDTSCETDEDCKGSSIGCGGCVNKNANISKCLEIYNKEVEKECIPQKECTPSRCRCVYNECVSETAVRVTDKLLTKDKEICSPSADDGTPYCNSAEIVNNFPLTWYNRECPSKEDESPEEIVIYDTTTETKPPGGNARIAYYCTSANQFWIYEYNSEKVPMDYWYGPFDGYPAGW